MKSYIYTFIRDDISPEQKIVQLGHATWEAALRSKKPDGTASLVLLHADDEDDLVSIAGYLKEQGIDHYMFYEPHDMMGYSAICTHPIYTSEDRAKFVHWNLYRHARQPA